MRRALLALMLWTAAAGASLAADPCEPCTLPGGIYHVAVPPDWDGQSRLRLMLYLHGWRQHGTDGTHDPHIAGVANSLGFLVIAPDGAQAGNGTGWGFVGSPEHMRDDLSFLMAVLGDAERRWPIEMDSVVAAGFSIGASMVWDLACYRAKQFTAFIPFAGGFWDPLPEKCDAGPVALRHTHGLHDSMVPLVGRPIMDGKFRQGDIFAGLQRWRAEDRCEAEPDHVDDEAGLTCTRWTQCEAPGEVELCLHDGDHSLTGPWLEAALRWAISARSAPAVAP
jgi:polyhydroxybutyrate depolymerase